MLVVAGAAALLLVGAASPQAGLREGYVTTSDSARIFYRVSAPRPDTLIAIHGGPGIGLESIAADFAPLFAKHTVIFYDQRGAGRSELPADTTRLAVARQIADLDEIRRHFGIARATLIAHSYGPLLAASYAIAHPDAVARMIFFGPVPPRRGEFWSRFSADVALRLDSAETARMGRAMQRISGPDSGVVAACRDLWAVGLKPRLAEPARTQHLIKSDLCGDPPQAIRYGLRTTNRVVMGYFGNWDLRDQLGRLSTPVLILHGEQEAIPMDLIREWVAAMPGAKLVTVPRAAHFPYVEQSDAVWPVVEGFLARKP